MARGSPARLRRRHHGAGCVGVAPGGPGHGRLMRWWPPIRWWWWPLAGGRCGDGVVAAGGLLESQQEAAKLLSAWRAGRSSCLTTTWSPPPALAVASQATPASRGRTSIPAVAFGPVAPGSVCRRRSSLSAGPAGILDTLGSPRRCCWWPGLDEVIGKTGGGFYPGWLAEAGRAVADRRGTKIDALPGAMIDFRANPVVLLGPIPRRMSVVEHVRAGQSAGPAGGGHPCRLARPAKDEALELALGAGSCSPVHLRIPAYFNHPEGGVGLAHH